LKSLKKNSISKFWFEMDLKEKGKRKKKNSKTYLTNSTHGPAHLSFSFFRFPSSRQPIQTARPSFAAPAHQRSPPSLLSLPGRPRMSASPPTSNSSPAESTVPPSAVSPFSRASPSFKLAIKAH
jgi:hypothetical protein